MSLKGTEKKLYQNEENSETDHAGGFSGIEPRRSKESPFASAIFEPDLEQRKEIWLREEGEKKEKRKKLAKKILIVAGAAGVFVGIIWLALFIRKSSFSEDRVKVSISGPEKVESGQAVDFELNYQNLNRVSLKNAVLYINYSENFKPLGNLQFESEGPNSSKYNIGDIGAKKDGKVAFRGKFFGPRDALIYMEVKLEYKSSTFNSRFTAASSSSVFISSSPLMLEVNGPQNAAAGNAVSYVISYQNNGQETFNDLKVKADFPAGFSYSSSEPLPSQDNNIWYIGSLEAGQRGTVKVNGTLGGTAGEEKVFKASIGEIGAENDFISYGDSESRVKIIGSPIVISETINDKRENVFVNAGETLLFKIKYRNSGLIGLRDVVLTVELASPVLDFQRLDMRSSGGEFDPQKNIITWRASVVPNFKVLEPGKEGEITFSVPVKNIIPISSAEDKNYSFSAIARMDSPDIPTPEGVNKVIASNVVEVKLNSKLAAKVEGFFNDADISNSGSIPLKVGQETTFAMHVKLTNVSNDVTDAKVIITLAPGVKWKDIFLPRDAAVSMNDRTNELVWNVGSLAAGTGIISEPKELIFQVGLTPSQNQIGDYALLLTKGVFSARDSFTGQVLETEIEGKSTNLREDVSVGDAGKVSP